MEAAGFPILLRVSHDESVVDRLQPEDMDALGREISRAFQRCAVPESQELSPFDREQTEIIMSTVGRIVHGFSERSKNGSSRDGALRMLFLKTTITPKNLQALFRMCDPSTRTGFVRCQAIIFLYSFSEINSTWNLQIPSGDDDDDEPSSCSFGKKQLTVMLNALTQKGFCEDSTGFTCDCVDFVLANAHLALEILLESSEAYEPSRLLGMLELLGSYDWPLILQSSDDSCIPNKKHNNEHNNEGLNFDVMMFMGLHKWACRFLMNNNNPNNDNAKAKTFLREKLGSCHELFRRVLRRIITSEIYSTTASSFGRSRVDEIEPIRVFLLRFFNCLVPVPADRETKSLVRRARMAMAETLHSSSAVVELSQMHRMENFLLLLDSYQALHDAPDQLLWDLFSDQYLSATSENKMMKKFMKDWKKGVTVRNNIPDGEMCANCFVLEKTLLDESNQTECLMKCTRCRQMKYCSKECQLEHWKKAHKKQCKKV